MQTQTMKSNATKLSKSSYNKMLNHMARVTKGGNLKVANSKCAQLAFESANSKSYNPRVGA